MEPQPPLPPQKSTPARRRAKRPVNSPARKTYASENDVPSSEALFPMELAGPFTPQKSNSNSPAPSSQPKQPKSKPRNANGNGNGNGNRRAKQVSSPGPAKQGRTTPPYSAASKAIPAAAFAGATFHASPAPSSLPIPSFLSKALDSPSVQETDHASREPSPPATDSEAAPTPQHRLLPAETTRQESPLDIFFRADRAEKERARRASSANVAGPNPVPFSPPTQIRSPTEPRTVPNGLFGAGNRRPGFQRQPSAGIPASELDGTPGEFIGPALSKPYQERIRAARSNKKPPEPGSEPAPSQQDSAIDMSERLKRFLAIPSIQNQQQQQQQQPPPQVSARSAESAGTPPHPFSGGRVQPPRSADLPSPFSNQPFPRGPGGVPPPFSAGFQPQRSPDMPSPFHSGTHPILAPPGSAPVPPATSSPENSRSAEIMHMEDSLRRMLKLNIGPAPAAPPPPPTSYQSS